jgi:chorismate synthase
VSVRVDGVPAGLGEPIYDKLSSRLAGAMLSINGATGFEIGAGFEAARRTGSTNNDPFVVEEGVVRTLTNNSGGIQGGISNGMPVVFRVAFKPPSSIAQTQSHGTTAKTVVDHLIEGRHDPSIVIRAVPVVEAMTLLVLADMWMLAGSGK